ncbi:uncharacterized protein DFL_009315 [Arthrobotrys flagrans]|uniref:Uncharacterized protein n=1 Tax=Arthrobotrys flagrans TaxID=97331 RepID=A0A436ZRB4_ARTFL|nr:hypothetical protein DFL_009315 [Arthrobotrys flagrans]
MKTRIPRIPAGGEQGNRENCNTVSAASSSRDRESNMCSRVAVGTDLLALTPFPPTIRPKYDVPKAANQLPTSEKAICKAKDISSGEASRKFPICFPNRQHNLLIITTSKRLFDVESTFSDISVTNIDFDLKCETLKKHSRTHIHDTDSKFRNFGAAKP